MSPHQIHTEEFAHAVMVAGLQARQNALSAGHSVVFVDELGCYIAEFPDGTQHEVRLRTGTPREAHAEILTTLPLAPK